MDRSPGAKGLSIFFSNDQEDGENIQENDHLRNIRVPSKNGGNIEKKAYHAHGPLSMGPTDTISINLPDVHFSNHGKFNMGDSMQMARHSHGNSMGYNSNEIGMNGMGAISVMNQGANHSSNSQMQGFAVDSEPSYQEGLNAALRDYWGRTNGEIHKMELYSDEMFHYEMPLARIKKIMRFDPHIGMIGNEAPVLISKACELIIGEIAVRAWYHCAASKRRTVKFTDLVAALPKTDVFDFLIDIVPREENYLEYERHLNLPGHNVGIGLGPDGMNLGLTGMNMPLGIGIASAHDAPGSLLSNNKQNDSVNVLPEFGTFPKDDVTFEPSAFQKVIQVQNLSQAQTKFKLNENDKAPAFDVDFDGPSLPNISNAAASPSHSLGGHAIAIERDEMDQDASDQKNSVSKMVDFLKTFRTSSAGSTPNDESKKGRLSSEEESMAISDELALPEVDRLGAPKLLTSPRNKGRSKNHSVSLSCASSPGLSPLLMSMTNIPKVNLPSSKLNSNKIGATKFNDSDIAADLESLSKLPPGELSKMASSLDPAKVEEILASAKDKLKDIPQEMLPAMLLVMHSSKLLNVKKESQSDSRIERAQSIDNDDADTEVTRDHEYEEMLKPVMDDEPDARGIDDVINNSSSTSPLPSPTAKKPRKG